MKITYKQSDGTLSDTFSIEFDAVIHEQHASSSTVTEHPIEKGSPINDHVRQAQDRLSVEATVSNTPLRAFSTHMRGVTGSVQGKQLNVETVKRVGPGILLRQQSQVGVNVLTWSDKFDRVRDVYAELKAIELASSLLTVEATYRGGLRDYQDMVLVSLTVPREVKDGSAITFSFDLVHVSIVETRKVNSAPKKKKSKGHQGKKKLGDGKEPQKESIAHAALRKLGIDVGGH